MTIREQCEKLAAELYMRLTHLQTTGEHWDKWDDKREIEKVSIEIAEIASKAYIAGTDDMHKIINLPVSEVARSTMKCSVELFKKHP